jgi:hypothetical protein
MWTVADHDRRRGAIVVPGGASGIGLMREDAYGFCAVFGLASAASPAKLSDHVEPASRQVKARANCIEVSFETIRPGRVGR